MKEIPLTRGFVTLVDDDDYPLLSQHKWCCLWVNRPYAVRQGAIYLHRTLLDAPADKVVYHLNGDSLDNRRDNLRLCERGEVSHAAPAHHWRNPSPYKGVSLLRDHYWVATIGQNGQTERLGSFPTAEEAAWAYDLACKAARGDMAHPNGISWEQVQQARAEHERKIQERRGYLTRLTDAMSQERQKQELTMLQLADILNVDISYISRMESHQRTPGAKLARRIEHWLSNCRQSP